MEVGLEFGAIVRLDHTDAERQAAPDFVDEPDGRSLIAGVVDLEDPDPRAIVNRRELIEAGPGIGSRNLTSSCSRWPGWGFS